MYKISFFSVYPTTHNVTLVDIVNQAVNLCVVSSSLFVRVCWQLSQQLYFLCPTRHIHFLRPLTHIQQWKRWRRSPTCATKVTIQSRNQTLVASHWRQFHWLRQPVSQSTSQPVSRSTSRPVSRAANKINKNKQDHTDVLRNK